MNDVPPLNKPGDCPVCGMELVPLARVEAVEAQSRLELDSGETAGVGIETAAVERRFLDLEVRMFGNIEYDPGYYTQLDAFTNGVIDKVYVRRTGEFIRQDQVLFDFYSAEIYEMELELLDLSRKIPNYIAGQLRQGMHPSQQGRPGRQGRPREPGKAPAKDQNLIFEPEIADVDNLEEALELQRRFASLRFRLRSYGLYDLDINEILLYQRPVGIISVRIPTMTSTVGGIVIENNTAQGRYVNSGTPLLTIADPHFVWARLEAFESDYSLLRVGQKVKLQIEALPGETYEGSVTQIDPVFDPRTRTFNVGVVYIDPKNRLRPNMLVRALVQATVGENGQPVNDQTPLEKAPLVIPASAPLITGRRAVVYVEVPGSPGTYEGREVVLGPGTDAFHVVREGLEEGEVVVTRGAFKLDSELQIQARPSMMSVGNSEEK